MLRRVLLLVCLAAMTGSAASAAPAATTTALRHSNTITADASRSMLVRLPAPVSVSGEGSFGDLTVQQNPDITVSGVGRITGLVLTQNTAVRTHRERASDGATLVYLSYGMCTGMACRPNRPTLVTFGFGPGVTQDEDSTIHLPAGVYRLFILADGGPVTASLRLHGLAGTSRLRPSQPAVTSLQESLADAPGARFVSDDYHELRRPGLAFISGLVRSHTGSTIAGGWCLAAADPETTRATDPVDGATACSSRAAESAAQLVTGGTPTPYSGHGGQRTFVGDDPPNGVVAAYATLDPVSYRLQQDQTTTPAYDGTAFLGLFLNLD